MTNNSSRFLASFLVWLLALSRLLNAQDGNLYTTFTGEGDPMPNVQPSAGVTYYIAMQGELVGQIKAYASSRELDPNGGSSWRRCDGSLLLISSHPLLYSRIGSAYGGNGATTFALPDLRGRVPVGDDDSTYLGDQVGGETVSLTEQHIPQHTHTVQPGVVMKVTPDAGQPHDNRQPSLAMNYIFRVQGDPYQLGEIRLLAGTTVPQGWVLAIGQELQIGTNQELYAEIGNVWGGNGVSTFRIPDLRGRALLGAGQGSGLTPRPLGPGIGTNLLSLGAGALPPHTHEANGVTTGSTGTSTGANLMNLQACAGITFAVASVGPLATTGDSPFLGEVAAFAKPAGKLSPEWREAGGGFLSIGQYQAFYSVIGTIWGGDGRTVFGLPDLRGRVAVGAGQAPGLSNRQVGFFWGSETKPFLPSNMPRHRHIIEIDSEAPVGIITTTEVSPTAATFIDVTVTFTEPVTGFTQFDLVTSPGLVSNFSTALSGAVYTFRYTPSTDGAKSVTFFAGTCIDEAQNANLAPAPLQIVFDQTPPRAVLSGPSSPSQSLTLPVTIDFGEVVTGFTASDLTISNGSLQGGLQDQGAGRYACTVRASGEGTVIVGLGANKVVDLVGFNNSASINLSIVVDLPDPYLVWKQVSGLTTGVNDAKDDDPNHDGVPNILHFAHDTHPLTSGGGDEGKRRTGFVDVGGNLHLSITVPVRKGAAFAGNPSPGSTVDGMIYTVQGGADLQGWMEPVSEVTPADSAGLPALRDIDGDGTPDWEYRTFILDETTLSPGFLRSSVQPTP